MSSIFQPAPGGGGPDFLAIGHVTRDVHADGSFSLCGTGAFAGFTGHPFGFGGNDDVREPVFERLSHAVLASTCGGAAGRGCAGALAWRSCSAAGTTCPGIDGRFYHAFPAPPGNYCCRNSTGVVAALG